MNRKLLEEFNAYFTSANGPEVSVPVAEWRKLYESLTASKLHYSQWKRGDILRVIEVEDGDKPYVNLGEEVIHDDNDGDNCPFVTRMSGERLGVCFYEAQLEFVERPE